MWRAMRSRQNSISSTGSSGRTGPGHDRDHHVVLGELARHAEGRGVEHLRMQLDDLLDLEGRDVLAAAADGVGAPADEVEVAVVVAAREVAGVEPQVAARRRRSPRACRSSRRDISDGSLRADHDLAHRTRRAPRRRRSSNSLHVVRRRWPARTSPGAAARRAGGRSGRRRRSSRRASTSCTPKRASNSARELGHRHAPAEPGRVVGVVGAPAAACAASSGSRP